MKYVSKMPDVPPKKFCTVAGPPWLIWSDNECKKHTTDSYVDVNNVLLEQRKEQYSFSRRQSFS
jgi:hypothetical protein